ncbi:MAG TPA: hypothetical protein PLI97_05725, partial [Fluviicola sp.]|nr:hypothetical protein [Fluviicola sp.]
IVFSSLTACNNDTEKPTKKRENLVEINNGVYTEYYPGRKSIKFRGPVNEAKERNGRWFFYDESGREQSMTEYKNGKKDGFIFVRYPNGNMRYTGEFREDKEAGIWKFYDQSGNITEEKNYDNL